MSKNKTYEVQERGGRGLADPMQVRLNELAIHESTYRLNWRLIVLFLFLNILSIIITIKYLDSRGEGLSQFNKEEMKQTLKKAMAEEAYFFNKEMIITATETNRKEMKGFHKKLMNDVRKVYIEHKQELANNSNRWNDRLDKSKVEVIRAGLSRSISSQKITIPYSIANMDILRYSHRQEYNTRKSELEYKKEVLISELDLTSLEDKKLLKRLVDKMDFELYALQRKQSEREDEFRRNKYRIASR